MPPEVSKSPLLPSPLGNKACYSPTYKHAVAPEHQVQAPLPLPSSPPPLPHPVASVKAPALTTARMTNARLEYCGVPVPAGQDTKMLQGRGDRLWDLQKVPAGHWMAVVTLGQ